MLATATLQADLIYHLPFDDGTNATLANEGSAGGTATGAASPYGIVGAPTPSSSTAKEGAYSELYTTNPSNTVYAGSTLLPNSTGTFRLDNNSSQMTLSTWINWNGTSGSNNRYGIANLFPGSQNSGWSFFIDSTGKLSYIYQNSSNLSRLRSTASAVITAETWTHVTLTVDTSVMNNSAIAIFVNGVEQSLTGSSIDTAVTSTQSGDLAIGLLSHNDGEGGLYALNGYMDDYAMWDTKLPTSQIKAINTAPVVFSDYNAGIMNEIFTAYDEQGNTIVDGRNWEYSSSFDASGKSLGDTWQGEDGKYYIWLDGNSSNAIGMVSPIPEPSTSALILCVLALSSLTLRQGRRRK